MNELVDDDDNFSTDAFTYESEPREYVSLRYRIWIDAEVATLAEKLMCSEEDISEELQKYIEATLLDRIPALNLVVRRFRP